MPILPDERAILLLHDALDISRNPVARAEFGDDMHLQATSVREPIWQEDVPHAPFIARHRVCAAVPPVKIADEGERVRGRCPFSVTDAGAAGVEAKIAVSLADLSEDTTALEVCILNFRFALEVTRISLAQLWRIRF